MDLFYFFEGLCGYNREKYQLVSLESYARRRNEGKILCCSKYPGPTVLFEGS